MQIAGLLPQTIVQSAIAAPVKSAVELVGGSFAALLSQAGDDSKPDASEASPASGENRLDAQRELARSAAPVSLDELRSRADGSFESWRTRLVEKLQAAGSDTLRDFALQVSADGTIREVSGHPDRTAIEQVLSADSTLAEEFRQIAALRDLLHAAEAHREFAAAYQRDPTTAVEEFASLFAGQHEPMAIQA